MERIQQSIACRGEQHTISCDGKNIRLDNHDIHTEEIAWRLGDRTCACYIILDAIKHPPIAGFWRIPPLLTLAEPFQKILREAASKRIKRFHQRATLAPTGRRWFKYSHDLWTDCDPVSSTKLAKNIWPSVTIFRESMRRIGVTEDVKITLKAGPPTNPYLNLSGRTPIGIWIWVRNSADELRGEIKIRIPLDWKHIVYDRGLSIVADSVVIDVFQQKYADHLAAVRRMRGPDAPRPWWSIFGPQPDPTKTHLLRLKFDGSRLIQRTSYIHCGSIVDYSMYDTIIDYPI